MAAVYPRLIPGSSVQSRARSGRPIAPMPAGCRGGSQAPGPSAWWGRARRLRVPGPPPRRVSSHRDTGPVRRPHVESEPLGTGRRGVARSGSGVLVILDDLASGGGIRLAGLRHALRAAALILSCDIVPLFRWPRPGARPPHEENTMEGGRLHARAVPLFILGRYRQRRAGVARIRQTWLPSARIRPPDGILHRDHRPSRSSPPRPSQRSGWSSRAAIRTTPWAGCWPPPARTRQHSTTHLVACATRPIRELLIRCRQVSDQGIQSVCGKPARKRRVPADGR